MNKRYLVIFLILIIVITFYLPLKIKTVSPYITGLSKILNILAQIAATGGLLGLLYQFKRERDLNEAEFITRINQDFITNSKICEIYKSLEESKDNKQEKNPFSEENIIDMANYLSFFGPFYGLTEKKLIKLETIDVLAYRFFLATNNRFMQEMLLCKEGKEIAWKNIYTLHKIWKEYRRNRKLDVWQEEFDLTKTPAYKEFEKREEKKKE